MKIVERVSKFPGTGNLPGKDGAYDADPAALFSVRCDLLKGISVADRTHKSRVAAVYNQAHSQGDD